LQTLEYDLSLLLKKGIEKKILLNLKMTALEKKRKKKKKRHHFVVYYHEAEVSESFHYILILSTKKLYMLFLLTSGFVFV